MKRELLDLIVCPQCGSDLYVRGGLESAGEFGAGMLVCDATKPQAEDGNWDDA
jgi:uncharacterized protein YbaR (Trm112 family)